MLNHGSGNLGDFGKKIKYIISLDKEEAWNLKF